MSRRLRGTASLLVLFSTALFVATAAAGFEVTIDVDRRERGAPLTPIWRFFGADEPNYASMKDGRRLLAELGALRRGDVYFREHNLLSSGDGTPALKWGSSSATTT